MRRTPSSLGLLLLALVTAGCEPPPGLTANSALLPLEGACPEDLAGGLEFTSEINRLRVRVTAPELDEPIEAEGDLTALTLNEIPVGEDRRVALYGLAADGTATWRGFKRGITVNAEANTPVEVLLSKVADLSCPRSPLSERRAFHTATRLADGRVLLVGGARSDTDAQNTCGAGCRILTATGSAEVYDPTSGTFTPAGTLQVARMFHTATLLGDGRVVVVGGVSEARSLPVDEQNPFPLRPRVAPTALIEVWDPTTNTFTAVGSDPNGPRMFHAAALTKEGDLLITGGITDDTAGDLSNATRAVTFCSGTDLTCLSNLQMQRKRAGHSLTLLDNGDVLAWGGSVETGDDLGVPGYKPEVFRAGQFLLLDTAGFSTNQNLFFAATTRYTGLRVLAGGGLLRSADGRFAFATQTKAGVTRGAAYVFDGRPEDGRGLISAGPYVDNQLDALVLSEPRFFGSAAPLPGSRAVFAGGFSSLDATTPSASLELYAEEPFAVQALSVGGQPRLLRQARGGLVATALGDGTVLLTGGATSDGGARRPVANGEIFTDPVDPGESR